MRAARRPRFYPLYPGRVVDITWGPEPLWGAWAWEDGPPLSWALRVTQRHLLAQASDPSIFLREMSATEGGHE